MGARFPRAGGTSCAASTGRLLSQSRESATVAADLLEEAPRGVVAVITPWNDPFPAAAGLLAAALAAANVGRYGLAATVLTPDLGHALRAVEELEVGTVKVNGVFGGAPGGSADPRRDSGTGAGYGPDLLTEMTVLKTVHLEAPGS